MSLRGSDSPAWHDGKVGSSTALPGVLSILLCAPGPGRGMHGRRLTGCCCTLHLPIASGCFSAPLSIHGCATKLHWKEDKPLGKASSSSTNYAMIRASPNLLFFKAKCKASCLSIAFPNNSSWSANNIIPRGQWENRGLGKRQKEKCWIQRCRKIKVLFNSFGAVINFVCGVWKSWWFPLFVLEVIGGCRGRGNYVHPLQGSCVQLEQDKGRLEGDLGCLGLGCSGPTLWSALGEWHLLCAVCICFASFPKYTKWAARDLEGYFSWEWTCDCVEIFQRDAWEIPTTSKHYPNLAKSTSVAKKQGKRGGKRHSNGAKDHGLFKCY